MRQYCRYCAFCFEGDVYFCDVFDKPLTDLALKNANNCHAYGYCGIDVITGKEHVERRKLNITDNESVQIRMDEVSRNET